MKELAIRSLAVFPVAAVFALVYKDLGILVGAALALGFFYLSRGSLFLILKISVLPAPITAVSSFFFRLGLLGMVVYLLHALTSFKIVAVLSSFIILYTLLLFVEMKFTALPLSH